MSLNLHHLALFDSVAQAGSVTLAAQRLDISQPAVSRQIKLLEMSLHTRLICRHSRGISLTPAGELLATYARRIVSLADEAQTALAELSALGRGRLRVGASPTLGLYVLPQALLHFRRRFPGLHTQMEIESAAILQQRIADGLLDLGLTQASPNVQSLRCETLAHEDLVPILPPHHPLPRKKSIPPAQFCQLPFIARETDSATRSFVERALASLNLHPKIALSLPSTESIKQAVIAGLGVSILPAIAVRNELATEQLTTIRLTGLTLRRPIYAYQQLGQAPSKPARAFLCIAKHALRGTLPTLPVAP